AEPLFAAPPLLNEILKRADIPAAINFWQYNARLPEPDYFELVRVEDMLPALGVPPQTPLLGWVFSEAWAAKYPGVVRGFLAAARPGAAGHGLSRLSGVSGALQVFRNRDFWLRCLSAAALLAIWQIAAAAAASPLLPGPAVVTAALVKLLLHGHLLTDLGISLARVAASFVLAMAIGSAIGIVMGRSRRIDRLFDLWLILGLNIPALVIILLCFVSIGLGEAAAVIACALHKVPTCAVILREGARALDREMVQVV